MQRRKEERVQEQQEQSLQGATNTGGVNGPSCRADTQSRAGAQHGLGWSVGCQFVLGVSGLLLMGLQHVVFIYCIYVPFPQI